MDKDRFPNKKAVEDQKADLTETDLNSANLTGTNLARADLTDTDLTGVTGLEQD